MERGHDTSMSPHYEFLIRSIETPSWVNDFVKYRKQTFDKLEKVTEDVKGELHELKKKKFKASRLGRVVKFFKSLWSK